MTTQIANTNHITTLRTMLEQSAPRLAAVAPSHLKVERLIRLMLAACSRTPKILDCTPESVLAFCMKCSETGLEPIGAGGAWAIPHGNQLTFVPDYRGLVNCAKRAKCIKDAWAEAVYANDAFDYELGLNPSLTHKPACGDRGTLEAAYCIFVTPDDTKRFVVMDGKEIGGIRKRSWAANQGPWVTDEGEMWKKTVVRRAMKPFAGASQQLDAAIAADDAVHGLRGVTERYPVPLPSAIGAPEMSVSPNPGSEGTDVPAALETPALVKPAQESTPPGAAWEVPAGCEVAEGVLKMVEPKKLKYREDAKDGTHKKGDTFTAFDLILDDGSKYGTFSEADAQAAAPLIGKGVRLVYKVNGAYRNFVSIHAG